MKAVKLNNRLVLGVALSLALAGSILVGDWQALYNDPCTGLTHTRNTSICFSHFKNETDMNITHLYQETCESQSNSTHQCFWNPQSRITGECCNTCHQVCLSKQTSLNFVQFCAGIFLISTTTPLFYVVISAITSDITPVESQVCLAFECKMRIFQCKL